MAKLQSMTGFSRTTGEAGAVAVTWEVKSVNGKSLEMRLRLPPQFERLEPAVRQAVQKRFSRGSFQAVLSIARPAAQEPQPVVNEAFLRHVIEIATRLERQHGMAPASADGLLGLRGVLEVPEIVETEDERAAGDTAILAVLERALVGLVDARCAEGGALEGLLRGHVDTIESLIAKAQADPARDPAIIRKKLCEQLRSLLDASGGALDEQRLHVEAMMLATKADIREELDRLQAHVAAARGLLDGGGVVGRRLDFLAQEFNREANTLCSKANAASLTAIGLDLKAVVDQFREQIQNLE